MLKGPKYYKMSNIELATLMKTYKLRVELGHDTKEKGGEIYYSQLYKIKSFCQNVPIANY